MFLKKQGFVTWQKKSGNPKLGFKNLAANAR
jgi:hypothetical protein